MSNSAQFTQFMVGDATNTLQDLSQYVDSVTLNDDSAVTNVTAFATGGGVVTESNIKGAQQSQMQATFFYDPNALAVLLQILGARGGSTIQARQGTNAAPTYGDQIFQMTATLFSLRVTYNTGQPAKIACDFRPTDGGAIIPAWYPG